MAIEIVSFPFKNGHFFLLRVMSTFTIGYISITIPVLSHYPMIIHIKKYDFPWFVVSVYHLVGGWPTPQKKIRVRQWGWWTPNGKIIQSCSNHHQNHHQTLIQPPFSHGFPMFFPLMLHFIPPHFSDQGSRFKVTVSPWLPSCWQMRLAKYLVAQWVDYPLVNVYINMEHHHVSWVNHGKPTMPCSIAMLNHVKLPESRDDIVDTSAPHNYNTSLWEEYYHVLSIWIDMITGQLYVFITRLVIHPLLG